MLGSVGERLREARDAFRAVFSNAALRRVEASWALSVTAYWVFIIALSLFAYEEGGAAAVGLVGLIRVLPSVVAAPFAALLGDRYPRQRVIFFVNIARTIAIAAAAVVALLGAHIALIYLLTALVGLMQSIFRPTQAALLPTLSRTTEELTAANLVLTTIESVGIFVGPAIGGILLALVGVDAVFAASAVAFLLSALLLAGVRPAAPEAKAAPSTRGVLRESFAGFTTIARDPRLRLIVGLYGAQTLVAGALNVLIVVSALELFDMGNAGIGFLNSAVGIGGLLGGFGALALIGRNRLGSDFAVGLVLWGLPILLVGVFPEPAVALLLLGIVGVGVTLVDVAGLTLLQRAVPDEVLTRVLGVVQSVFVGTLGLGAILAPVLISAFEIRGALIISGALLPVLAAALLAKAARARRRGTCSDARAGGADADSALPAAAAWHARRAGVQPHPRERDRRDRDRQEGRAWRPFLRRRLRRGRGRGREPRRASRHPWARRPLRRDRASARRSPDGDGEGQDRRRPLRARAGRVPERGHRTR